jgi:hypothetical protein
MVCDVWHGSSGYSADVQSEATARQCTGRQACGSRSARIRCATCPRIEIDDQQQERDAVTASELHRHENQAIDRLRQRLEDVYVKRSPAEVRSTVDRAMRRFTNARVRDYIPLLVERISRDELGNRFTAV